MATKPQGSPLRPSMTPTTSKPKPQTPPRPAHKPNTAKPKPIKPSTSNPATRKSTYFNR